MSIASPPPTSKLPNPHQVESNSSAGDAGNPIADAKASVIWERIEACQRALWRAELTRRALGLVIASLAVLLAWIVIDHWVWSPGPLIRLLAFAGGLLSAAVFVWHFVWPVTRQTIQPEYAARAMERDHPELGHALSSYVMLAGRPDSKSGLSNRILQSVGASVAAKLQTLDQLPSEATGLMRWWLTTISLLAVVFLYAMSSPKSALQSTARLLQPLRTIAPPQRVQITDVVPGDTEQLAGRPLNIAATVTGLRREEPVQFLWHSGELPEKSNTAHSSSSIPLHADTASSATSNRFIAEIEIPHQAQGSRDYYIVAGDATAGPFQVKIRDTPVVMVDQITYRPPAYTGQPQQIRRVGAITGLDGTQVTVAMKTNRPVQRAVLEFNPQLIGDEIRATAGAHEMIVGPDGQTLTHEFVLRSRDQTQAGVMLDTYRVQVWDDADQSNVNPIIYPIEVVADLPPEITIVVPQRSPKDLPLDAEQVFEIHAADVDFGLSEVEVEVRRGIDVVARQTLFKDVRGKTGNQVVEYRFRPSRIVLGNANRRLPNQRGLGNSSSGLRVGDQVEVVAIATDNRTDPNDPRIVPGVTRTEPTVLRITAPANDPATQPETQPPKKQQSQQGQSGQSEQSGQGGGSQAGQQSGGEGDQQGQSQDSQSQQGQSDAGSKASENDTDGSQGGSNQGKQDQPPSDAQNSAGDNNQNENGNSSEGTDSDTSQGESMGDQDNQGQPRPGQDQPGDSSTQPNSPAQKPTGENPGQSVDTADQNTANGQGRSESGAQNNDRGQDSESGSPNANNAADDPAGTDSNSNGKPQDDADAFERIAEYLKQQQQTPSGDSNASENSKQSQGEPANQAKSPEGTGQPEGTDQTDASDPTSKDSSGDKQNAGRQPNSNNEQSTSEAAQRSESSNDAGQEDTGQKDSSQSNQPSGNPNDGDSKESNNSMTDDASESNTDAAAEPTDSQDGQPQGNSEQGDSDSQSSEGQPGSDGQPEPGPNQQPSDSSADSGQSGEGNRNDISPPEESAADQSTEQTEGEPGNRQGESDPDSPPSSDAMSDDNSASPTQAPSTQGGGAGESGEGASGAQDGNESAPPMPEAADLNYTKQATDMVLDYIDRTRENPDPKLLDQLDWSEEDLRRFRQRWQDVKPIDSPMPNETSEQQAQKIEEALRSLGMRNPASRQNQQRENADSLRRLRDAGNRQSAPPAVRDAFEAFRRNFGR